jgi:hypothetical protein
MNHDLTVEREQSLTMAGVVMTPGGDRAIVVDSDYEQNKFIEQNPNSQQFFEQRQSVDAEEEDRSDAANAEVSVRRNSVVFPDTVTDHHA